MAAFVGPTSTLVFLDVQEAAPNKICQSSGDWMFGRRRRRWINIISALGQCLLWSLTLGISVFYRRTRWIAMPFNRDFGSFLRELNDWTEAAGNNEWMNEWKN